MSRPVCTICGKSEGELFEASLAKLKSDMVKEFIPVTWKPSEKDVAHAECVLSEIRRLRKTSNKTGL